MDSQPETTTGLVLPTLRPLHQTGLASCRFCYGHAEPHPMFVPSPKLSTISHPLTYTRDSITQTSGHLMIASEERVTVSNIHAWSGQSTGGDLGKARPCFLNLESDVETGWHPCDHQLTAVNIMPVCKAQLLLEFGPWFISVLQPQAVPNIELGRSK